MLFSHILAAQNIIVIKIEESPGLQKPVYIKDAGPIKGGYKRIGASDIRLSDVDLQRIYREKPGSPDSAILSNPSIDDLDVSSLNAFRELRKSVDHEAPELKFDDVGILKSYGLIDEQNKLTAACVLLFGKKEVVRRHFPAFELQVIRISDKL